MRYGWILVLVLATSVAAADRKPEEVGPYLQSISVTLKKSGNDRGSGTIITRKVEGKSVNWVLTAEHVVAGLRTVKDVIAPDGSERKQVAYRDCQILQELREDGRTVGEIQLDAKVVSVDPRRDIALLRVRKADFLAVSAEFAADTSPPPVGTPVLHCGSPGGQAIGAASVTNGVVSRIGVRIEQFGGADGIFDAVTCAGLPGSSGGMVCLQANGRYIGMVTLGLSSGGDSFHWIVPIRTIAEWAGEVGAQWLLDEKAKPPSEEDVEKIPLELSPAGYATPTLAEPKSTGQVSRMVLPEAPADAIPGPVQE